jgi:hypothetical protein
MPVSCRSLVDRCGSLGSFKSQIIIIIIIINIIIIIIKYITWFQLLTNRSSPCEYFEIYLNRMMLVETFHFLTAL